MPPGKADLTLYQGDDFSITATFLTAPPASAPINITGHTFKAEVRETTADADGEGFPPLAAFTCSVINPTGGVVLITMAHGLTRDLPARIVAWDLQGTDSGGLITTYLAGKVTVTAEVTRP